MRKQKTHQTTSVTVGTKTYYVGSVQPARFIAAGVLAVLFAVFFTLPLLKNNHAAALALTWDGGGADNNWTTCANWSSDTCPGSGDALTFNSTSTKDSTVDASFAGVITSINITTGYSGTITLARSLQTTSTFTQSTGTFTASSFLLDVDGAFSATGGTFNASSGTMTFAAAFTTGASVTFNHNSGTVTFDGGTSATLTCNSKTFNLVTFNNSALKTVASSCTFPLGANPTVAGSGQITSAGTFSGSGTFTRPGGGGQLSFSAGAVLSGFTGISAVNFGVAGATLDLSGYSSYVTSGTTSISSGSLSLPSGADLNSALSITGGTFTAPSGTMTVAGALTISGSPTFNANGGTITFDGSGANVTLACNNVTFNSVTFAHTVNTKVVSSDCSMPLGASPTVGTSTASVTLSGTFSGSGTLSTTGTLTINSTGVLSGFTGYTATGLTITGATTNFSSYSPFSTSGTFTVQTSANVTLPSNADINNTFNLSTSSTLNMPNGSVFFAGTMTLNSGTTFNANSGTVVFDSSTTATLTCNSATFNLVSFTHTGTKTVASSCSMPLGANPTIPATVNLNGTFSGSGTLTSTFVFSMTSGSSISGFTGLSAAIFNIATVMDFASYTTFNVSGNFNMSGGTFGAPSGTFNLGGNFTITAGTYNHNNGTLNLNGSSTTTLSCSSATLFLVTFSHTSGTKTVSSNCTLPMGANPTLGGVGATTPVVVLQGTMTGSGTLTMIGTAGGGGLRFDSTAVFTGFNGVDVQSFNVNGGTISLAGYTTVNIGATLSLSSGTLTASENTMSLGGNLSIVGGTFVHNSGTMRFSGTQTVTLTCNNVTFNRVEFTHTSGTKVVTQTCTLPLGTDPTETATGDILNYGTLSGSGTLTTQDNTTLYIDSQGTLSGFTNFNGYNISLSGSVIDLASFSAFTVRNDLTIQNHASLKAPNANNLYVGGDLINQSGDGGLILPGMSGQNASAVDSAALSVTGDLDIRVNVKLASWQRGVTQGLIAKFDASASNQRSYQLQIDSTGLLWFEGSAIGSTTAYSAISTAAVTGYNGTAVWVRMTRNSTTGDVNFYTSTNGTSWTQLGTTVTATAGSIFDGTAPLVIGEKNNSISPSSGKYYRAQVRSNILDDGTGIVFDADFSSQTDGATSFTESSSNAATVTINGTYAKISGSGVGSFDANNGTVNLNGGDQEIQGDWTFHNLTKEVTTAAALTFPAGRTITVEGLLRLKGKGTQYLYLVSSSPGIQWLINRKGTSYMSKLVVKDSRHTNNTLVACFSIDNGNNTNWAFNTDVCYAAAAEASSTGDSEVVPTTETDDSEKETIVDTDDETSAAANQSFAQKYRWPIVVASLLVAGLGVWWLIGFMKRRNKEDDVY